MGLFHKLTSSELFTVMTGGFATVAGGVFAAYVMMLQGIFPDIAGHLLDDTPVYTDQPAALMLHHFADGALNSHVVPVAAADQWTPSWA